MSARAGGGETPDQASTHGDDSAIDHAVIVAEMRAALEQAREHLAAQGGDR